MFRPNVVDRAGAVVRARLVRACSSPRSWSWESQRIRYEKSLPPA